MNVGPAQQYELVYYAVRIRLNLDLLPCSQEHTYISNNMYACSYIDRKNKN